MTNLEGAVEKLLTFATGENCMRVLLAVYLVTFALFCLRGNWNKVEYWLGAMLIMHSVLNMK